MKNVLASLLLLMFCHFVFAKSNLETSGDILHILLPAATFGATLLYENDDEGSWQLINTGLVSRVIVEGLKFSVSKQRPDHSDDDSFPSGHTADTFAASTFIQQRYGWKWAIPAYLTATYVGYTRVNSDQHDTEDVLIGAAIGVLSGLYFTTPYHGMSVHPFVGKEGQFGLSVSSRF